MRSRSSASSTSEIENTFSHLLSTGASALDVSDASDDDALSIADTDATSECSHTSPDEDSCACENDDDAADFLDTQGQVGVAVESLMFLDNIQHVVEAVKLCWTKAGKGEVPVAATAAYTNVLLARAVGHVRAFHQNEPDLPSMLDVKQRLSFVSCDDHQHTGQTQQASSEVLESLAEIEVVLCPDSGKPIVERDTLGTHSAMQSAKGSLIQQLIADFRVMQKDGQIPTLSFDGLSSMEEVGKLMTRSCDTTTILTASVLLYMISTSHCAYSVALSQPSRIALPRISSLKMANEALSPLRAFLEDKSIFPCQCINTLGYRVAQMKSELEAFSKHKCWNALIQSPVIAGNHAVEILDVTTYYGMHLFHYRQYVAAVLHTYQALVQMKALDAIPILEEVCDLFAPVLYTTGIRPQSGFMASWLRYIGARLKFRKGKRYQDHKDTWCMSVPAHAAARSAGLNVGGKNDEIKIQPKFDYGTIDHTIRMKREGWVLQSDEAEILDRELCSSCPTTMTHTQSSQAENAQSRVPVQKAKQSKHKRTKSCQVGTDTPDSSCEDCLKLDHRFNACFTADFSEGRNLPSSRLNLLSLFHSMTRVVSGISDATHADDGKDLLSSTKDDGKGQMCLCFVQTVLRGADRISDVRRRSGIDAKGAVWSKNEKNCSECFREHLMKMLGDANVLDGRGGVWLWSSI